jgi:hypothetical protein
LGSPLPGGAALLDACPEARRLGRTLLAEKRAVKTEPVLVDQPPSRKLKQHVVALNIFCLLNQAMTCLNNDGIDDLERCSLFISLSRS